MICRIVYQGNFTFTAVTIAHFNFYEIAYCWLLLQSQKPNLKLCTTSRMIFTKTHFWFSELSLIFTILQVSHRTKTY